MKSIFAPVIMAWTALSLIAPALSAETVEIPDPNVRAAIRHAGINFSEGDPLTTADLETLRELRLYHVVDLTGVQDAANLETLTLVSAGQVRNLASLGNLTALKHLQISGVRIGNLSFLSELQNLEKLVLRGAGIEDIEALAGLQSLVSLSLDENAISDISPLASLNLQELFLYNNRIADISVLAEMENLSILWLGSNRIANIESLSSFTEMSTLSLADNNIEEIGPLSSLQSVNRLHLDNNRIADISPLAGLNAAGGAISLANNQIEDISALAGLENLRLLNLSNNRIVDLRPLNELRTVSTLDLSHNRIVNAGPLIGLESVDKLDLSYNNLPGVAAAKGLNVAKLILNNNLLTEIGPLADLDTDGSRLVLELRDNRIADLSPLADLAARLFEVSVDLDLAGNKVRDLTPLQGFDFTRLSIKDNPIEDLSPLFGAQLHELTVGGDIQFDLNTLSNVAPYHLNVYGAHLTDLGFLAGIPSITLSGVEIENLGTFPPVPDIQMLSIVGTGISDISPLLQTRFGTLILSRNQIGTLPDMQGARIGSLTLSQNHISDISPLAGLQDVMFLDLSYNRITDLTPLDEVAPELSTDSGPGILNVDVSYNRVTALPVLGNPQRPMELDLEGNRIADLSSLSQMENVTRVNLVLNGIDFDRNPEALEALLGATAAGIGVAFLPQFEPWWDGLQTGSGYCDTSANGEAGIGWLYNEHFPWAYSYGLGTGEWIYILADVGSRASFYAYAYDRQAWIWGSSEWGWYFQMGENAGWQEFNR